MLLKVLMEKLKLASGTEVNMRQRDDRRRDGREEKEEEKLKEGVVCWRGKGEETCL